MYSLASQRQDDCLASVEEGEMEGGGGGSNGEGGIGIGK